MRKESKALKIITIILSFILVMLIFTALQCNFLKGEVEEKQTEETVLQEQDFEPEVTGNLGKVKEGLNVNQGTIEGVPVIEYFDTTVGMERRPIVFLLHGLSASKESYEFMGKALAEEGYFVVTPDARLHGDRKEGDDMWIAKIVTETSKDLDSVLKYYSKHELVNIDKVCLAGFSLGGLITYDYIVNGQFPITAGAIAYATPTWHELEEDSVFYMKYGTEGLKKTSSKEKKEVKQYLVDNSPYEEILKIKNVSLGLVNGGKDEVFTCDGTVKLYQELLSAGADVAYCFREDGKHEFTDDDMWLTFFFIIDKLK